MEETNLQSPRPTNVLKEVHLLPLPLLGTAGFPNDPNLSPEDDASVATAGGRV